MEVIIEDTFYLYKKRSFKYNVTLTSKYLKYCPISNHNEVKPNAVEEQVLVDDVIGCACMKISKNKSNLLHATFITIFAYPLMGNKPKRKRKTITFEVSNMSSFSENLEVARKWKSSVYYAMHCAKANEDLLLPALLSKTNRKLLLFINPKSGPGIAQEIYLKKVKPILNEAGIPHDIVVTDHANHAYEAVQYKDFSLYAGIVIVAGDGLMYEVYNGLLQRDDCDTALSIPVGIVPGGSGNGLASSISHLINEPYNANPILVSTLNIVNPVITPMDLVLVHTESGHDLISFLSIGFGILSDIDIESERLRAIGEARFTVYGLTRIFNLRKYRARISYKVAEGPSNRGLKAKPRPHLNRSQTVEEGPNLFKKKANGNAPLRSHSVYYNENEEDLSVEDLTAEPTLTDIENIQDVDIDNNTNTVIRDKVGSNWNSGYNKIPYKQEKLLDEPVPNDWETIEDDFVSIYVLNQPYIGSDALLSPNSTHNDGVMWLCLLRGNVTKTTVFKFLVGIENGTHINIPEVTSFPVTGIRIVPLCSSGKITVDGELIDFGAIQANILPGKGRVMVRRTQEKVKGNEAF